MIKQTLERIDDIRLNWPTAFALSSISVAGGDSVMPPWVRAQLRDAARIVRDLREKNSGDAICSKPAPTAIQNRPCVAGWVY